MNDVLLPLLLALPLAGALALLLLPGSSGERVAVPFGVGVQIGFPRGHLRGSLAGKRAVSVQRSS